MKLVIIGGTGTIGRSVVAALSPRHEVIVGSRHSEAASVDITSLASLRALFDRVGLVDGVICTAGAVRRKPLAQLETEDFAFSLNNKLMGQVNVVRAGLERVRDSGVIVVTRGQASRLPSPGGAAISMVNAELEGFVRVAALEAPRGIRVNAVSPPWSSETLAKLNMDPKGGLPASVIAQAYVRAVETAVTGQVIEPTGNAGD
ncbi:MAG: short chain dehydrogenase [Thermoplasmata archaeon]